MNTKEKLFLAGLYSGLSPFAPGTMGSILGLVIGIVILHFFPVETLFLLTILITVLGIKEINKYEKRVGFHDDKHIVIDEVAGMWLALCIASNGWVEIVLSFLFFRLYDISKPSIIGRIDKETPGGLGVMGDDIVAGALAGLSSALVWQIIGRLHLF